MKKKRDGEKHPTNQAGLSIKPDDTKQVSLGLDKRGGRSPKG